MASVWSTFAYLPDPRNGNARRHNLLDILTIALIASIRGTESRVDFARDRACSGTFLNCRAVCPATTHFRGCSVCLTSRSGLGDGGNGVIAPIVPTDPIASTRPQMDNGRIEIRRHAVSHDVNWMLSDRRHTDEAPMPGLAMLGMVEATVTRDGKTTTVRRHYLSSVAMDATRFATAGRAYWRIENCLHWVLDVGFDEDRARNRRDHGPENPTTPRKPAVNRSPHRAGGHLSQTETQALRVVRRIRPLRARIKCDSLRVPDPTLAFTPQITYLTNSPHSQTGG